MKKDLYDFTVSIDTEATGPELIADAFHYALYASGGTVAHEGRLLKSRFCDNNPEGLTPEDCVNRSLILIAKSKMVPGYETAYGYGGITKALRLLHFTIAAAKKEGFDPATGNVQVASMMTDVAAVAARRKAKVCK